MLILDHIFFEGVTEFIWYMVLAGGGVALIASFVLSVYRIPLQLASIIAFVLGIYNLGIIANEAKWDDRMKDTKRQIKEADAEIEHLNEKLAANNEKARGDLNTANGKLRDMAGKLDKALTDALAAKNGQPATPQSVIQNLSDEERKQYENMNAEQKKEYENKIADLIKKFKECQIPQIIIDKHNTAAEPRLKKADSKGEKK